MTMNRYQNLRDATKVVLKGKVIALNAYMRKKEMPHINDFSFHFKNSEKEEKIKCRLSIIKKISEWKSNEQKNNREINEIKLPFFFFRSINLGQNDEGEKMTENKTLQI